TQTAQTVEALIKKSPPQLSFVPRGFDLSQAPSRIVFGSCFDQDLDAHIWTEMAKTNPDLVIMMGDNIYSSKPHKRPFFDQYRKMEKIEAYRTLRQSVPFLAVWDDHDYGVSDGGTDNPDKAESKRAFSFHYPYIKDSTLLDQPGLYHSKMFGGVRQGKSKRSPVNKSLHVIVLDTRWNKSPWNQQESVDGSKVLLPSADKKTTLLGEAQWAWLEDQLKESSDVKILVSSMQVLAESHGFERWGQFPHERERLLNLISRIKPKNLILLSGDRHFASISKLDLPAYGPLYEFTSSPLNTPKGNITESQSVYQFPIFVKENFGLLDIDLNNQKALIEIRSAKNEVIKSVELKLKK
ncbi:MAG: alkaline phosphatase D family protein, partial [Bdellovibrionales bacterium]